MNLMMILRQLWNQRAANGWILGELVVVTYFLWGVVDPVYVLLSDKALPDHYDLTDTYLLSIGEYSTNHTKYKPEMASDSLKRMVWSFSPILASMEKCWSSPTRKSIMLSRFSS